MKSCNIRYIFQNKDKNSLQNIYDRKNERKRLALLPNPDFTDELCDKVTDNVFDIVTDNVFDIVTDNVFDIVTGNLYEDEKIDIIADKLENENHKNKLNLFKDFKEAIQIRCLDLIGKTPAEIYGNNTMKSKRVERFKLIRDVKKIKFVGRKNKIMKKLQQLIEKIHPYSDMDK